MIRFRTIEPETAAKPDKAPAPAAAARPPEPAPAPEDTAAEAKPKGLTRKTPLRAKKSEAARLFEE